jgi:hypothetical protein
MRVRFPQAPFFPVDVKTELCVTSLPIPEKAGDSSAALPETVAAETFLGVVFRRTRYAIAVVFSGWLFCTLGWKMAAPPPEWGSFSLLAWSTSGVVMATLTLTALLLLATAVSTLLVHPDTPHMGLCCALVGLGGLSIRGGTSYMLIRHAELTVTYREVSQRLAVECVQWGVIFLVAEMLARGLHDRFFANTSWLNRTGVDLAAAADRMGPGGGAGSPAGIAGSVSKTIGTAGLPKALGIPLAMILSMLLASWFLYCFLQTPNKGQVMFGCFGAFLLSTLLTYYAFPRVAALAMLLAAPATGAVGYLWSANYMPKYPGHAGMFFGNALPIDYVCAGIPGAIFGYYLALHWDLHSRATESA